MIRVLLADDQPLIRSGFRALLDLEDDIEVVAEAADGEEGLALVDPAVATAGEHFNPGYPRPEGVVVVLVWVEDPGSCLFQSRLCDKGPPVFPYPAFDDVKRAFGPAGRGPVVFGGGDEV